MEALHSLFPATNFSLIAVVLGLPALGALVNGLFGKRLGKEGVRLMALSAIGGAFIASLATFLLLPKGGEHEAGHLTWTAWHWLTINGRLGQPIPIDVAFNVDGMSATMMLIITGVGFLIHLYSSSYMEKDEGFWRFFAYLNLFCFSMLVLVTAANLPILFVGWEGVGLCSYLLIGFWFEENKNASAGKKAFIVNRIGDFGLIVAMALLVYYAGTLSFQGIADHSHSLLIPVRVWPIGNLPTQGEWDMIHQGSHLTWLMHALLPKQPVTMYASTLVGLAIFLGCAGKSAQLPLYVWLPDAMAGPTPVSALIHAATMVTAGVYLVARTSAVFVLSPGAMATVAVVGALTAFIAASIGLFQWDLKKVLAYSTVSQLGFMFIGVGVGAFTAGFFHVVTHAFFKACLFLGAGSVIHAVHVRIHDTDKSQDMRNMGGLKDYMPVTRWTFLASCLAIAGCPPFAGFWSKDEILWQAFSTTPQTPDVGGPPIWAWPSWLGPMIFWIGIIAATMTAFYMFRAYFLTFHGRFKGWSIVKGWVDPHAGHGHGHDDHHHHEDEGPLEGPAPRESPLPMIVPLAVLGALATFGGFLDAEMIHVTPLGHLLEPIFASSRHFILERDAAKGLELPMMIPGFLAFLAGTGAAMYMYWNRGGAPELSFARSMPRLYKFLQDKWRVDELYDATIVGMVDALADIFVMADRWIIDGILAKLTAALTAAIGTVLRAFQTGRVQVYAAGMVIGLAGLGWFYVRPHAKIAVADDNVRMTGQVVLTAPAGLGYSYRWDAPGVTKQADFSPNDNELKLALQAGEKKDVHLYVKNAFGSVASAEVSVTRPASRGGAIPVFPGGLHMPDDAPAIPSTLPAPAGFPSGHIPADQLPDLIRGGRAQ